MRRISHFARHLNPGTIVLLLVIMAIMASAGSFALNLSSNGAGTTSWWVNWIQSLGTWMFGSAITFWLIGIVYGGQRDREAKEQAIKERKEQLIRQLGSKVNAEAIRAAEELGAMGWQRDGTLRYASLPGANLQGVDLNHADLRGANFQGANLEGTNFYYVEMQKSRLDKANLRHAEFQHADMRDTSLERADLFDARFEYTNLQRADLTSADAHEAYFADAKLDQADLMSTKLEGAFLGRASLREVKAYYDPHFDVKTTLPDGTYWHKGINLARFTDPNHPEFFRVDLPYWQEDEPHTEEDIERPRVFPFLWWFWIKVPEADIVKFCGRCDRFSITSIDCTTLDKTDQAKAAFWAQCRLAKVHDVLGTMTRRGFRPIRSQKTKPPTV